MANRFWVGGSGTWDATTTTNWSATSGGAGGASAPTSADGVTFDSHSNVGTGAFTVTVVTGAVCLNFTASGLDVAMTLALGSSNLSVYGNWSNQSNNFATTFTNGQIIFASTSTGKTITTNGVTLTANVRFNGAGGSWTLGSALTVSNIIYLETGTLSTSGSDYAITADTINTSFSTARTLTLNNSTVTLASVFNATVSTNLTVNPGTSTINLSSNNATFNGGSLTYYDLGFTGSTANTVTKTLTGTNTFHNVVLNNPSTTGMTSLTITGDQTLTGRLTSSSGNNLQRMSIKSATVGTTVTLTCSNATISNTDFRDITIAGAAAPVNDSGGGDCGGNSGITFPAPKTVYWNLATGGNWSATAWATSSGGGVSNNNFPLAQDTAIIENTGLNISATITYDSLWAIGNFSSSTRTNAATINFSNPPTFYGNMAWGSGLTTSSAVTWTFVNRTTKTFNSAGYSFPSIGVTVNAPSGGLQLLSNVTLTTGNFTLTLGTFDLNNFVLTNSLFGSSGTGVRTIAFGTGSITCNAASGLLWNTGTATNLTVTGTPVVNISSSGSGAITVDPGDLSEANSISFNFTSGTYTLTFPNSTTRGYRNLDFTGFSGIWDSGPKGNCYGNLTLSPTMTLSTASFTMVFAATSGVKTITSNGKTINFSVTFNGVGGTWQLQDAMTLGATKNITFTNGTVDLNGKTFTANTAVTALGTKNITFNGGTLIISGSGTTAWSNAQPTNFSTTAGTGTGYIQMISASAKTFSGGGSTYNCTLVQAGAGTLTISGNNTFTDISATSLPSTITLTSGTTQTFSNFSLSGTAGNLLTLNSTVAGSRATVSKSSGTVSVSYMSIKDSSATGGASWQALTSNGNVNGGNTIGWLFSLSNFLIMFL